MRIPKIPAPTTRHNRRHQRNPELLARGRIIHACGMAPSSATNDQLLAWEYYLDDQIVLAKGGLRTKKEVRAEKKKRGL